MTGSRLSRHEHLGYSWKFCIGPGERAFMYTQVVVMRCSVGASRISTRSRSPGLLPENSVSKLLLYIKAWRALARICIVLQGPK